MRKNVVQMKQIVEKMNLKNLTPDVELSDKVVEVPDINRPALQLTGFFERFDSERVQVIGYVEYSYLTTLEEKKKQDKIDKNRRTPFSVPLFAYRYTFSRISLYQSRFTFCS